MNIGSICWPSDARAATAHYLRFIVDLVVKLKVNFPEELPDPVATADSYAAGRMSEAEYRTSADRWWAYLDSIDPSGCEMGDVSALRARLGLCLLSANLEEASRLGEHLSWFLELLGLLGVDLDGPFKKMESYFAADHDPEVK